MIYSCFDIGGTAIKFGLIDETGRFRKKGSQPRRKAGRASSTRSARSSIAS